jgi:diguanylate cyclase (GGDEF)-like protein/putative nucleotidyltransferase with HDIG domain
VFGTRARAPRPVLLVIVYGIFLVIVGVTATAQTMIVSLHFSTAALNATVASDAATVRTFANGNLRPSDLTETIKADRMEVLQAQLAALVERGQLERVELRNLDGAVLVSSDPTAIGLPVSATTAFAAASGGKVDIAIAREGEPTEVAGTPIPAASALREYFPLLGTDGKPRAVFAMWRDAGPILAQLDAVRLEVVIVTLSAAAVIAIFLMLIFRSAQGRISRQTAQLVEATRRDALTGMLNHGALVGELALAIEKVRETDGTIGVALLDLDGFRLLNDTHGHEAGDTALMRLAARLEAELPKGSICGRYGPDEFLVIAPAAEIAVLEPMVRAVRTSIADESLEFGTSERLPMSFSAGIAAFPIDGSAVTELLSVVALTLAEAKASGGDAVRVAGHLPQETAESQSFDILQGLVFAVDTKDRYTKLHSEDVSRYATFLASRLGLDPSFVETVRTAGLLHDIGKIGIPDTILRKPGRLTADEQGIVKQHVALGDSIVRNLENTELIRAGIRHHHERWDGRGYLHALASDDIPLIARILAVADAYSAMTTSRPYRKALSVEESLIRLADAAGTQLDESLVAVFITGIEQVPDAPMPGVVKGVPLWVPRVA